MNVTSFGQRVLADIKGLKMKLSLIIQQMAPQSNDKCCSKRHTEGRQRGKRRQPGEDGAEIGVMQPQAGEYLEEIRQDSHLQPS